MPGSAFHVGAAPTGWVRAAFSTSSPEQIDTALQRLGEALRAQRVGK